MKLIFNLSKTASIIKEAMAQWRVYGAPFEWWSLQQIVDGDPGWNKWVNGDNDSGIPANPRMKNAFYNILKEYYKRKLELRARYGVSGKEVDSFYKVFVGFSPASGVSAMHIGPYMAEDTSKSVSAKFLEQNDLPNNLNGLLKASELVQLPKREDFQDKADFTKALKDPLRLKRMLLEARAEKMNKFGYFTKTYNKVNEERRAEVVAKYVKAISESMGVLLDASDLSLVVKAFPPSGIKIIEEGENVTGQDAEGEVVKSLDPKSPEMQKFFKESPVIGDGTYAKPNGKGMAKIYADACTKNGWKDLYDKAVEQVAISKGITIEEARMAVLTDVTFGEDLLNGLKNIQKELKKNKDIRANFLTITTKGKLAFPKVGAQRPSAFRIDKQQISIAELKLECLRTMSQLKTNDYEVVATAMKDARKKMKTKASLEITPEIVEKLMVAIAKEDNDIQKAKKKKQNRSAEEILVSAEKDYENIRKNEELRDCGADDIDSILRIASNAFLVSELEYIDPKTKAKIPVLETKESYFASGEEPLEITAKALTDLRAKREVEKGSEEVLQKALKSEILQEIGDLSKTLGISENEILKPSKVEEGEETEEGEAKETVPGTTPEAAQPELGFGVTEMPQKKIDVTSPTDTTEDVISTPTPTQPIEDQSNSIPAGTTEDLTPNIPPKTPKKKKKLDLGKMFGSTFESLIRMARDLDLQGKEESAEEIHKIIRKYHS